MGSYDYKMVKATRLSISATLVDTCQINNSTAIDITDFIIKEIGTAIVKDKKVKISGFGSFLATKRAPRKGRNLQTGAVIEIPPQIKVTFTPSTHLKKRLQKTVLKWDI